MPVELFLGSADGCIEVVVIKGRVDDGVAVVLQVRPFDAARTLCQPCRKRMVAMPRPVFPERLSSQNSPPGSLASITNFGKVLVPGLF